MCFQFETVPIQNCIITHRFHFKSRAVECNLPILRKLQITFYEYCIFLRSLCIQISFSFLNHRREKWQAFFILACEDQIYPPPDKFKFRFIAPMSISAYNLENVDYGFKLLSKISKTDLINKIINQNCIQGTSEMEAF